MNEISVPPAIGHGGTNPHIPVDDLNAAATQLVLDHGQTIMLDALEYSANSEDADDAYQRSLEILLTKAPSTDPETLVPWLRVVVRNEALDIARRRARTSGEPIDAIADSAASNAAAPEETVVGMERAGAGAEALERLTRDQVHCLLAYAQGNSYGEISDITGFTARKVTRCVTEGRRAFTAHFAAIQSGSECERLEPVLQRMADGDPHAHVEARSHLRNCTGCRATLRAYREAPARIAVLFPLPLVAAASTQPAESVHGLLDHATAAWSGALDRVNSQAVAVQQWFEVGTAKKLGVIGAAVAALTAGGVAVNHSGEVGPEQSAPIVRSAIEPVRSTPRQLFDQIERPRVEPRSGSRTRKKRSAESSGTAPVQSTAPAPPPATSPPAVGDGSDEFLPESR